MSTSLLSALAAPMHTGASTSQAPDRLARQPQAGDFGQALARSVTDAQNHARREQASTEAKNADAKRTDAHRLAAHRAQTSPGTPTTSAAEQARQRDKAREGDADDWKPPLSGSNPSSPEPSSAALGVLNWLGAHTKAHTHEQGSEAAPPQASQLAAAGTCAAPTAGAAPTDAHSAHALATASPQEAPLPTTPRPSAASLEIPEEAKAPANDGEDHSDAAQQAAGAGAGPQPEWQAAGKLQSRREDGLPPKQVAQFAAGAAAVAPPTSEPRPQSAPGRAAPRSPGHTAALASAAQTRSVAMASMASMVQQFTDQAAATAPSSSASASPAPGLNDAWMGLSPDAAGAPTPETTAAPLSAQPLGMAVPIEAEVGSPAWHQALSQQVMHMRAGHMNQAELQLNPAGLGLLRIKLSLQEQEVNAEFFAVHAQVREALEAALPQLRESLQQGGMALGQAVVTGAQPEQSEAGQSPGFAGPDNPMQGGQSRQGSPGGQGAMDPPPPPRPAPQPFRGTPSDDAALQKPRQGPGQHLHTFA